MRGFFLFSSVSRSNTTNEPNHHSQFTNACTNSKRRLVVDVNLYIFTAQSVYWRCRWRQRSGSNQHWSIRNINFIFCCVVASFRFFSLSLYLSLVSVLSTQIERFHAHKYEHTNTLDSKYVFTDGVTLCCTALDSEITLNSIMEIILSILVCGRTDWFIVFERGSWSVSVWLRAESWKPPNKKNEIREINKCIITKYLS